MRIHSPLALLCTAMAVLVSVPAVAAEAPTTGNGTKLAAQVNVATFRIG